MLKSKYSSQYNFISLQLMAKSISEDVTMFLESTTTIYKAVPAHGGYQIVEISLEKIWEV